MWILESWKNQSESGKDLEICFWKRLQTLCMMSTLQILLVVDPYISYLGSYNSRQTIFAFWLIRQQGCGLRKITRSPKVLNHEILGAQQADIWKNSFSSHPKTKVRPGLLPIPFRVEHMTSYSLLNFERKTFCWQSSEQLIMLAEVQCFVHALQTYGTR